MFYSKLCAGDDIFVLFILYAYMAALYHYNHTLSLIMLWNRAITMLWWPRFIRIELAVYSTYWWPL